MFPDWSSFQWTVIVGMFLVLCSLWGIGHWLKAFGDVVTELIETYFPEPTGSDYCDAGIGH